MWWVSEGSKTLKGLEIHCQEARLCVCAGGGGGGGATDIWWKTSLTRAACLLRLLSNSHLCIPPSFLPPAFILRHWRPSFAGCLSWRISSRSRTISFVLITIILKWVSKVHWTDSAVVLEYLQNVCTICLSSHSHLLETSFVKTHYAV